MNNQLPWYYSWPTIILAFLFFWPVGIALLIMRNNSMKKTSRQSLFVNTNKKMYITIGGILIFFGLCMFSDSFLMGLFFLAGGIALIAYSGKLVKSAERRKKYIDLIVNNDITGIEKIASICNVQYSVVLKELNQMISLGVLKGAYVDESARKVVLPPAQQIAQNVMGDVSQMFGEVMPAIEAPKMVAVSCPGCGAKMTIRAGSVVECEYCSAAVSAQ